MVLINFDLNYYEKNKFLPVGDFAVFRVFSASVLFIDFVRFLADEVVCVVQTQLEIKGLE